MTHWPFVGVLSLLAFWLRTGPRYHQVFGIPGFVNFTETDAWFHVRIIRQMVGNFPHRLTLDPYGRIDGGQSVDTGIFFDAIPAFIGWIAGLSDVGIHQLAAWYPAILGALLIPVTFLCGRSIFNQKAGLWAAAVVATLPGHFLHTGSLGFTDHHVMEALLTSLLLYLLTSKAHPLLLGATLTAYLLTFAGGAFVVALITIWYWLEAARGTGTDNPNPRDFALACLMAAPFTIRQQHVYLTRYSRRRAPRRCRTLAAARLRSVLPKTNQSPKHLLRAFRHNHRRGLGAAIIGPPRRRVPLRRHQAPHRFRTPRRDGHGVTIAHWRERLLLARVPLARIWWGLRPHPDCPSPTR